MILKTVKKYFAIHQQQVVTLLILCAAILGVVECILATPFGPGVGSDAVVYISSARNLLAGQGLGLIEPDGSFRLLPYFPPFYPLVLSALGLITEDLVAAARWMNALLFGGLIAIVGFTFYRYTRNAFFAIALSTLLALSTVLINVSAWAMSEPISLFVGFLGLLFLLIFLEHQKMSYFILSAVLTGLAFLSRFASVAFCLTGCLALLVFIPDRLGRKVCKAILYGAIAVLPMMIWTFIAISMTGTLGSRSPQHLSDIATRAGDLVLPLKVAFYEWTPFVIPASRWIGQPYFRIGLMMVTLLLLWVVIRTVRNNRTNDPEHGVKEIGLTFFVTFLLFGAFYLLVIAMTYIFTFPPITLSNRMFSPLFVAYQAIVVWVCFILASGYRSRKWLNGVIGSILILVIISYGFAAQVEVRKMSMDGLGYNAWAYRNSELIAYAGTIPETTPLITNKAPLLLYYTGRSAYTVQEVFNPLHPSDFLPYGSEINDEAQRIFRDNDGALVLFNSIIDDFVDLYGEEQGWVRYAIFVEGLRSAYQADDGQVYYYP